MNPHDTNDTTRADNERTTDMTAQHSADDMPSFRAPNPTDYTAEPPVSLRSQGLRRRAPEPEPEPELEPAIEPVDDVDEPTVATSTSPEPPVDVTPTVNADAPIEPSPQALAYSEGAAPRRGQPEPQQPADYGIPQQQPDYDLPQYSGGFVQQGGGHVLVDPDPRSRRNDGIGQARPDLLDTSAGIEEDPAEWGWRGRLNALGMHLKPRPDSEEVEYRHNLERIRQPLSGFWKVAVINVKGGMGKTPTTLMLSNTLGVIRGGGVVAWDSNESKGTLSERAATSAAPNGEQPSVWDVLEHAGELAGPSAQSGALSHFLRKQPTMDEILASDQSSKRMKAIGRKECAAIEAVLRRHRSGVIIDTGNDDTSPNWQWVTENVHQLVIPMPYRRDAAAKVVQMLDGLHARDLSALVSSAIVVLAPAPGADESDREAIIEELRGQGVHRFFDMPYEAAFEGAGHRIVYNRLPLATRVAVAALTAEIVDSLAKSRSRAVEFDAGLVPQSIARPAEFDVRGTRRMPAGYGQQMTQQQYPPMGPPSGPMSAPFPAGYPGAQMNGGQMSGQWPAQQHPYYQGGPQ